MYGPFLEFTRPNPEQALGSSTTPACGMNITANEARALSGSLLPQRQAGMGMTPKEAVRRSA